MTSLSASTTTGTATATATPTKTITKTTTTTTTTTTTATTTTEKIMSNNSSTEEKYKVCEVDENLKVAPKYKTTYVNNINVQDFLKKKKFGNIEACSKGELINVDDRHGFVAAVRLAHSFHFPLCLAPDHFWALIIQGFGEHMDANSDQLKDKFVNFDGKKELIVRCDNFTKGSDKNPWPEVFPKFSQQIKKNIGDKNHKILLPRFTTTNETNRVAHELGMMHSMRHYFAYKCITECGISKVKLLGTLDDWKKLREATKDLAQYDLGWWTKNMVEIFDKIIKSYENDIDKDFWKSIYKFFGSRGSGTTPMVNGWIMNFFPYLNGGENGLAKRSLAETMTGIDDRDEGIDPSDLETSTGINRTPFKWDYDTKIYDMTFISGFAGVTMTEEYVMPMLSWAIAQKEEQS